MRALLWIVWAVLAGWLGWSAIYKKAPAIEQDILARSTEAVKPANANAEVLVDGRFVTVRGPEPTEEAKANTLKVADNVYGALGPYDGLWVPVAAKAAEFLSADKLADGKLVLTGSVPSDEAKAAVEAAAKEGFSGAIDNQLIVSGAGGASTLADLPAALKSLASLDVGSLLAMPDRFRLSGASKDQGVVDTAAALASGNPAKWSVFVQGPSPAAPAVVQPEPAPGHFAAFKAPNGGFIAAGEVASDGDKTSLLETLRAAANGGAVVDRLNVRAEGLPMGWSDRIASGVKALAGMDWGSVSLDGAKSFLNGSAAADKVKGLVDGLGEGWTSEVANTPDNPDASRIAALEAAAKSAAEQTAKAVADAQAAAAKSAEDAKVAGAKLIAEAEAKAAAAKKAADEQISNLEKQVAEAKAKAEAAVKNVAEGATAPAPAVQADQAKVCNEQMTQLMLGKTIEFATASANVTKDGMTLIDAIANAAKPCLEHGLRVEVAGHTDDQGDDAKNMDLSQRRADAVKDALVSHGLPAADVSAKGYGETRPVATNETAEGRAQNRRINFDWSVR